MLDFSPVQRASKHSQKFVEPFLDMFCLLMAKPSCGSLSVFDRSKAFCFQRQPQIPNLEQLNASFCKINAKTYCRHKGQINDEHSEVQEIILALVRISSRHRPFMPINSSILYCLIKDPHRSTPKLRVHLWHLCTSKKYDQNMTISRHG